MKIGYPIAGFTAEVAAERLVHDRATPSGLSATEHFTTDDAAIGVALASSSTAVPTLERIMRAI